MIEIKHRFPTFNAYINKERSNRYAAASSKKKEGIIARSYCKGHEPFKTPCKISLTYYVKNKRVDLDGWAFARKVILDSMVKEGVLPDDSLKYVIGIQEQVVVDSDERVIVEVIE